MKTFTKSSARSAAGRLVLTAALAAMPILTACGASQKTVQEQQKVVEVHLSEGGIQLPESLPPGKTTFKVINDGTSVHSLEIEGPSGDKTVPTVAPGQKASLEMILDPGTYRVSSPGADQSLQKALTVTQS